MTTRQLSAHLSEIESVIGASSKVMMIMRGMQPIIGCFRLLGDHTIGKMKKALHNHMKKSIAVFGFLEDSADV